MCVFVTCSDDPLNADARGVYLPGELLHSLGGVFVRVRVNIGPDAGEGDCSTNTASFVDTYFSITLPSGISDSRRRTEVKYSLFHFYYF